MKININRHYFSDLFSNRFTYQPIRQPRRASHVSRGDRASYEMAETAEVGNADDANSKHKSSHSGGGDDEGAVIPRGTINPVYEAKARVLNHAVCNLSLNGSG